MPRIKTFYDELGVQRDATSAQIKQAFKEIAKVYHPDKNPPEKQQWAHEQMSRLNFVVETLLNPATRQEYNDLVRKYETAPAPRPRRPAREQHAIEREYAQVSVEIINLSERYANYRLKILIGSGVGIAGATLHILGHWTELLSGFPMTFAFSYFFALLGGIMIVMGLADFRRRAEYQQRIDELEARRTFLRQRMFEAYVS